MKSTRPTAVNQPALEPPGKDMVWIPGGTFLMGSEDFYPEERPVHEVTVDGFWMDEHEVTVRQFRRFVKATGYVTLAERPLDPADYPEGDPELLVPGALVFHPTRGPVDLDDYRNWWSYVPGASWRHPEGPGSDLNGRDRHPITHVAWEDVAAFAAWIGKELPTEAEWEFAARGSSNHADHAWGNAPWDSTHPQAHIYTGSFPTHDATTVPVGRHAPNANGLYDMSGNVWHWTQDVFDIGTYGRDQSIGVVRNPVGADTALGPMRTLRGGSYLCNDSYCRGYRVSARSPNARDSGASHIGFRTVMTVAQWRAWNSRRNPG